jgi:hypothetical protein
MHSIISFNLQTKALKGMVLQVLVNKLMIWKEISNLSTNTSYIHFEQNQTKRLKAMCQF